MINNWLLFCSLIEYSKRCTLRKKGYLLAYVPEGIQTIMAGKAYRQEQEQELGLTVITFCVHTGSGKRKRTESGGLDKQSNLQAYTCDVYVLQQCCLLKIP